MSTTQTYQQVVVVPTVAPSVSSGTLAHDKVTELVVNFPCLMCLASFGGVFLLTIIIFVPEFTTDPPTNYTLRVWVTDTTFVMCLIVPGSLVMCCAGHRAYKKYTITSPGHVITTVPVVASSESSCPLALPGGGGGSCPMAPPGGGGPCPVAPPVASSYATRATPAPGYIAERGGGQVVLYSTRSSSSLGHLGPDRAGLYRSVPATGPYPPLPVHGQRISYVGEQGPSGLDQLEDPVPLYMSQAQLEALGLPQKSLLPMGRISPSYDHYGPPPPYSP